MEPHSKRARFSSNSTGETEDRPIRVSSPLKSLNRTISPPPRTRSQQPLGTNIACPEPAYDEIESEPYKTNATDPPFTPHLIPSPIQLTHIKDYPTSTGYNVDTVRLHDILGDPMIRECWQFNYMFDVDFLMSQFDEDVRALVEVKVVHGSWRTEAPNRIMIEVSIFLERILSGN